MGIWTLAHFAASSARRRRLASRHTCSSWATAFSRRRRTWSSGSRCSSRSIRSSISAASTTPGAAPPLARSAISRTPRPGPARVKIVRRNDAPTPSPAPRAARPLHPGFARDHRAGTGRNRDSPRGARFATREGSVLPAYWGRRARTNFRNRSGSGPYRAGASRCRSRRRYPGSASGKPHNRARQTADALPACRRFPAVRPDRLPPAQAGP